jgi:putative tricarboxylic transport membrane protein
VSDLAQHRGPQGAIGAATVVLAVVLAWGARDIASHAGYAGVGPNFLPWLVAGALAVCGSWLLWDAHRGGWRAMPPPGGAARGDWRALAWVVAGVAVNAALITRVGFILACTLCFVLAVRGLRLSEGRPAGGVRGLVRDGATGALIAAPSFWLFTRLLGVSLPSLTGTAWL